MQEDGGRETVERDGQKMRPTEWDGGKGDRR